MKYYCLTAASALFTYTESSLFVIYNKQSLKVEYQESEGYCTIDVSTADKLELVAPNTATSNERYASLYGILNYCLTKIGARTLRATILQPSCSIPDIEARLDCVTELKKNSNMMMAVQTILPKISNIDQLLSLATLPSDQGETFTERHLMYVLTLNALLNLLEPLKEIFEDSQQPFFKEIRTTLENETFNPLKEIFEDSQQPFFKEIRTTLENETFNDLTHIVRTIIQPDAHPAKGQQGIIEKCFLIKPGVNGLLDVLRKTYSERVEDLREYVNQLRDKYNLPLTLNNNSRKGYHISLQLNAYTKKSFKKSELPNEFIQVDRLYSSVTMMTNDLINLASRIDDILLEILKMSSVMVYQILIKVRDHIGLMYKLCEDIAKLDMIQSLAQASSGIGYARPEFGDYLEITNSRHPLLDFLCSTEPTSNSIFATSDHNVHIITGPNGSGKSIFIRQVLLLQVMAQVGCFIPAEFATLRVCDRILARIKEIQYFHTVMTANTLIIIDELCRSTAVDEGTYLAMATIESLAKNQAFIFVATHYTFVTNLEEFYPNLTNWQMETNETKNERTILQFTFSQAENLYDQIEIPKEHTTVQGLDTLTRLKYNFEAELKMLKVKGQLTGLDTLTRLKYNFEAELKMLKVKGQLTASILEEESYIYHQYLKSNGLDILNFVPRNPYAVYHESNLEDGQNLTFQVSESEQPDDMDFLTIYPEALYSPSIANSAIIH
ncbi:MutS domain V [Popillia japonica]|uniref:MutS domain V n=1 Tax=Popillia japonica TaxID=7064 RepID=A0AAW1MFD2_POPJA